MDYNELCAEIHYDGQFVAIIDQEKGLENLEISLFDPNNQKCWTFEFSEFVEFLLLAKRRLIEMQKQDS